MTALFARLVSSQEASGAKDMRPGHHLGTTKLNSWCSIQSEESDTTKSRLRILQTTIEQTLKAFCAQRASAAFNPVWVQNCVGQSDGETEKCEAVEVSSRNNKDCLQYHLDYA